MKLLICGSRQTTEEMRMLALSYLLSLKSTAIDYKEWEIIVGDADGIDAEVQRYCETYQFVHSIYYPLLQWNATFSIAERLPRNKTQSGNLVPVKTSNYLKRDEAMVEDADICVAIWNEESKGTLYTYEYAKKLGKQCWLFGKDGRLMEHIEAKI